MRNAVFALAALSLFTTSCLDHETDNLSLAQSCLDKSSDSNPQSALSCLQYTTGYSSQQAMIINCSIYLTAGGLTTTRISKAYTISQDNTVTNKTADYVAMLAFTTYATPADGVTAAQSAEAICNQTGDMGLIFISNMAVLGSVTNNLAGGIDLTGSTASIDSAVQTAIAQCTAPSPPASCDPNIIAPAATVVANSYCASPNANTSVCGTINQAVTSWGGDNATLTSGIMCLLQGKTFDPSGPTCT